ncbi:MAG: hypothetical protein IJZ75_04425 [Clostridia bacterium]|nr:hypothetical protein [Clostridia bacterium]
MKVREIAEKAELKILSMPDPEREVIGAYMGDLLSWVMGRAGESNVWITIMSNINVVAVASLADVSCVILSEGVELEEDVLNAAKEKGINILSTNLPSYETAIALSGMV